MLENLTKETFAERVGETFLVEAGPDPLELELAEVSSLGESPGEGRREPFALLFSGPPEPALLQAMYPVENPILGRFDLFLVPVGPGKEGTSLCYEAIFT